MLPNIPGHPSASQNANVGETGIFKLTAHTGGSMLRDMRWFGNHAQALKPVLQIMRIRRCQHEFAFEPEQAERFAKGWKYRYPRNMFYELAGNNNIETVARRRYIV